ncbi:DMT family transporter [Caproiciproducens sp. MSJ-32]|uniref:DMT family transporter n=1 Tax=Caproiciproducens sp. MSJ-32 TaxID=2841527 RepID=UPI001C11398D|nr:DMT family transporter [Caproiciproducens sp. MSJ-32]MBU5454285.1 DMT family transporter [Caproiciproducens sp. MSJ-32]
MLAIIFAIISGISMTLQGVFNTNLEKKIGTWETALLSQGIAFVITLIIVFIWGNGDIKAIKNSNKIYLLSGVLGVVIIFTVMKSIASMGATIGIGTILTAQLLSAAIIDAMGLFETEKVAFSLNEFIGVALMIAGIIVFKLKL